MTEEIGLFEAIYTQRALRYIKPDPLPDALIRKVLDAGIRAPNEATNSGGASSSSRPRTRSAGSRSATA